MLALFVASVAIFAACGDEEPNDPISVNPSSISLMSTEGNSTTFQIITGSDWTVTNCPDWLNISAMSGHGNTSLTVTTIKANQSSTPRSAVLTIATASSEANLTVTQLAGLASGCDINVVDQVIMKGSAAFDLTFGNDVEYYYFGYIEKSSAGWTDERIINTIEENFPRLGTDENYAYTAGLSPATDYVACLVGYNKSEKHGDLVKVPFTTPSANLDLVIDITYANNGNVRTFTTDPKGATSKYYNFYWEGDNATYIADNYNAALLCLFAKAAIDKGELEANYHSTKVNTDRTLETMFCAWGQNDKNQFSGYLNALYIYFENNRPMRKMASAFDNKSIFKTGGLKSDDAIKLINGIKFTK